MAIASHDVTAKARCEVEKRLDDMGFDEREHGGELRGPARQYYLSLIEEDLANSHDMDLTESLDSAEGMTLGFVAGYEACLHNHS